MKKSPPPRSSSRHKTNPLILIGNLVSNFLPFVIIAAVGFGFYQLMYRKEQIHSVIGDTAIVLGLLAVVAVALYLNPNVQQKFQAWGRARIEKREKQFWKGRDINDARQARAQEQAEAERKARIAAREARLAAAAAAKAQSEAASGADGGERTQG